MNNKKPEGCQAVSPYLILKSAEAFIDFMKNVFNAELLNKHMRDENIIMHAEVKVDDSVIMFADSTDQYTSQTANLFVYVDDADETYKKALESGSTVVTEMSDQSYGRTGGVKDPFGNTWWITTPL